MLVYALLASPTYRALTYVTLVTKMELFFPPCFCPFGVLLGRIFCVVGKIPMHSHPMSKNTVGTLDMCAFQA